MAKTIPFIRDNTEEEEAEIQRQIAEDPDTWEFTGKVAPREQSKVWPYVRPDRDKVEPVTVCIDREVLSVLQTPSIDGWEKRMNDLLREAVGLK